MALCGNVASSDQEMVSTRYGAARDSEQESMERLADLVKQMEELIRGAAVGSARELATPRERLITQMQEFILAMSVITMMQENQSAIPDVPLMKLSERDNIEDFLHAAERTMAYCEVRAEQWAPLIAQYLTGRALQTYRALGDKERENYEAVKEAILQRYKISKGIYRCLFKEALEKKALREARWRALRERAEKQAVALVTAAKRAAAEEEAEKQRAREAAEQAAAKEAAEKHAARDAAEQAARREAAEQQAAREAAEEARVAEEAASNKARAAVTALSATEAGAATSEAEAATMDTTTREMVATDIVAASKVAGTVDVAVYGIEAAREAAGAARTSTVATIPDAKRMATLRTGPVLTTAEEVVPTRAMTGASARLTAKPYHWAKKRPALARHRQPAVT